MSGSYTRESQQARKQAFVRATIACLAEYGYHGTSVRRIAEKANVAPGLLTHYFSGKEELIAAAYRDLAETTFEHSQTAVGRAGSDPHDRLRAFVTASFFGPELPFNVLKVWVNFWSLTFTEPLVREAHALTYRRFRERLGELIRDVFATTGHAATAAEIEHLAIGANAVIDGLWLEYSLDPDSFDSVQAAQIACEFIGRGIGAELAPLDASEVIQKG